LPHQQAGLDAVGPADYSRDFAVVGNGAHFQVPGRGGINGYDRTRFHSHCPSGDVEVLRQIGPAGDLHNVGDNTAFAGSLIITIESHCAPAVDVVQPDFGSIGGFTEAAVGHQANRVATVGLFQFQAGPATTRVIAQQPNGPSVCGVVHAEIRSTGFPTEQVHRSDIVRIVKTNDGAIGCSLTIG